MRTRLILGVLLLVGVALAVALLQRPTAPAGRIEQATATLTADCAVSDDGSGVVAPVRIAGRADGDAEVTVLVGLSGYDSDVSTQETFDVPSGPFTKSVVVTIPLDDHTLHGPVRCDVNTMY